MFGCGGWDFRSAWRRDTGGRNDRFQPGHSADPFGELHSLSRTGCGRSQRWRTEQGRAEVGHAGRRARGHEWVCGHRPGAAGRKRTAGAHHDGRRDGGDASAGIQQETHVAAKRAGQKMDRARCAVCTALGLRRAEATDTPGGARCDLGSESGGPLHSQPTGTRETFAGT